MVSDRADCVTIRLARWDFVLQTENRIKLKKMKILLQVFALILTGVAFAQQNEKGVAVDAAPPMGAPNYATKWLPSQSFNAVPESQANPATITYNISFADPSGPYSSYYPAIVSALHAAGAEWNFYLVGSGSLEIEVIIDPSVSTANGGSVTSGFVRNDGTRDIFEQGAAYEVRTGIDPNGAGPDIRIRIGIAYLTNELWFDPNPTTRTTAIPANHIDAISILTHELGHAFLFNGWRDGTTGQLPATYMSTFDEKVNFDGTNFYFVGAGAQTRYGGPVPLTYGNATHVGNALPRPGSDLIPDLMNGIVYNYQTRYFLSPIDLEIARDSGMALVLAHQPAFAIQNSVPRVSFATTVGQRYHLEYKDELTQASWQPVPGGTVSGTGTVVQVSDPDPNIGTRSHRFYHVSWP